MQIDQKTFNSLIPQEKLAGLSFWNATAMVDRFYCGPLTVHSICPGICSQCQDRLLDAFNLTEARNPAALLTYSLKVAVAKYKEVAHEKQVTKRDTSLFPVTESPFERILNEI